MALAGLKMATLSGDFIGLLTHRKFNAAHIFATPWIGLVIFENASMPAVALPFRHNQGALDQRLIMSTSVF